MAELTLRETCKLTGVTRRAIQGYEKLNLVSPTARTKQGYLLYAPPAVERIKQIALYQQMGFSLKEIQTIIDAPADLLKSVLIYRKSILSNEIEHRQFMITTIQEMLATL